MLAPKKSLGRQKETQRILKTENAMKSSYNPHTYNPSLCMIHTFNGKKRGRNSYSTIDAMHTQTFLQ